jgi:hypothetical protein
VSSRRGANPRRPFYRPADVERLAEATLLATGLYPPSPSAVRIDRVVEKHFDLTVEYEVLPSGVLGCTLFECGRVRRIVVSSQLDDDPSRVAERRLRTTLAHEAGHGLMHAMLFDEAQEASLFDGSDDVQKDKVLCRDGMVSGPHNGRWWEVQANMVIGPLLLPSRLAREVVEPFTSASGLGVRVLRPDLRHAASLELAAVFDVNPIVAQYRLDVLFPAAEAYQLTL